MRYTTTGCVLSLTLSTLVTAQGAQLRTNLKQAEKDSRQLMTSANIPNEAVRTLSLEGHDGIVQEEFEWTSQGPMGLLSFTETQNDGRTGWIFHHYPALCDDCYAIQNYRTKRVMTLKDNKHLAARRIPSEGLMAQDVFRLSSPGSYIYYINSYQNADLHLIVDQDGRPALKAGVSPPLWSIRDNFFPSHDTCSESLPFEVGDSIIATTGHGATPDEDLFGLGVGFNDGPGVWFKFIGTGNIHHLYVGCESNWNALIKVFVAESCTVFGEMGSEVGGNGYACNRAMEPLQTVEGQEYWVLISGQSIDQSGDFELSMVEDDNAGAHCNSLEVPGSTCNEGCRDFQRTCRVPNANDGYRLTQVVPRYSDCRCDGGTLNCHASLCGSYPGRL